MTEEKVTNRDRIGKAAESPKDLDFTPPEFSSEQLLGITKEEKPEKENKEPAKPSEKGEEKEAKKEEAKPAEKQEAKAGEEADKEKEPADPVPVVKAKKTKADYIAERLAKKAEKAKEEATPLTKEGLAELLNKREEKPAEAKAEAGAEVDDLATDLLANPKEAIERIKAEIRAETLKEVEGKFLPEVERIKQAQMQRELNEHYKQLNNIYDKVAEVDADFMDAYDALRERLIDTLAENNPTATAAQIEQQLAMGELALVQQAAPQIELLQRVNGLSEEQAVAAYFKYVATNIGWQPQQASAAEVVKEKTLNEKRQMKERAASLNGLGASVPSAREWAAQQSAKMTNRERAIANRQAK